jgi:hypothetical protein
MFDEKTLSGNGEEASPRALSSVPLNYIPIVCGISSNRLHILYLNMLSFMDSVVGKSLATIETLLKVLGNLKKQRADIFDHGIRKIVRAIETR